LTLAVVALTLQFSTTLAVLALSRASRFGRMRWFALVAFTAGCYSVMNVVASVNATNVPVLQTVVRVNLLLVALHAAAWLVFAHTDDQGGWAQLPAWVRRTVIVAVPLLVLVCAFGDIIATQVPAAPNARRWAPIETVGLNAFGTLITVVPFALLVLSGVRYTRRMRLGEPGAGIVLVGFTLFLACMVEEIAVAGGLVDLPYLADVGYVCVVIPVAIQLMRRFRNDAAELDRLSTHLAEEVQRRTEERDAARQVLIEQQRLAALGRLAAGVGHEINNPLQYLRSSLEELRDAGNAAAVGERIPDASLAHAFEGVDRIRQVVDALRTYARPSTTDDTLIDVRDVVQSALRIGAPQLQPHVTVVPTLGDVPLVEGNEGRLVQVILNPLVNGAQAIGASSRRGPCTLRVSTRTGADGWVEIEVADNGPGFAPEVLGHLGEPYVTTRAAQGGTGLGLFVSRGIVEAHGGSIHFSNAPDGGAVVLVRLPPSSRVPVDAPPAAPAASPAQASPDTGDPLRVLLVEDDAATLRALMRALAAEGMDVVGKASAGEALDWLDHDEADVVVTDLMMPGVSGSEFASALASRHPQLRDRLVVLTGGAATPEAEAFLAQGGLLVLEKPITRQQLAAQLRSRAGRATAG
jgi:signal transduction histidine kinase/ActR/RegA family two-component response regulator